MIKSIYIYILIIAFLACNMPNGDKKPGQQLIQIEDTLSPIYLPGNLTEKSLVTDTIYRIEINNNAVIKTIDSINKVLKNDESRMWEMNIYKDHFEIAYISNNPLFFDKEMLFNTYYIKLDSSIVLVRFKDSLQNDFKTYKKGILVKHLSDQDIKHYYDFPFDHPLTYYIDQKGKIIQTRFKDYYNR